MRLVFDVASGVLDCQFLDFLPLPDDCFIAPEVDVSRCDVVEALVVSLVVVVIDERPDLVFEVAGQVVVFEQNPIFHGLVPTLNLALGLRMERKRPLNPLCR